MHGINLQSLKDSIDRALAKEDKASIRKWFKKQNAKNKVKLPRFLKSK